MSEATRLVLDENYIEECPECHTPNKETHWMQKKDPKTKKDRWVCLYCYNGNYNEKQVERIRNKKLS